MKNQPGTMKNHENRPGTIKNQPGTMKNHENLPGTIKKPTWNHENHENRPASSADIANGAHRLLNENKSRKNITKGELCRSA